MTRAPMTKREAALREGLVRYLWSRGWTTGRIVAMLTMCELDATERIVTAIQGRASTAEARRRAGRQGRRAVGDDGGVVAIFALIAKHGIPASGIAELADVTRDEAVRFGDGSKAIPAALLGRLHLLHDWLLRASNDDVRCLQAVPVTIPLSLWHAALDAAFVQDEEE